MNAKRKRSTKRLQIMFDDKSLTEQHHKEACDVNTIVNHWAKTGVLAHAAAGTRMYQDVSTASDYFEQLNTNAEKISKATEYFMDLPAAIRRDFQNDPAQFFEFASDAQNEDKLIEYGLLPKKKPEKATTEPPTAPIPPSEPGSEPASSAGDEA